MFLANYRPYIPEGVEYTTSQKRDIFVAWVEKHKVEISDFVDIVSTIIHTRYRECQLTHIFTDKAVVLFMQQEKGIITHCEFGSRLVTMLTDLQAEHIKAAMKGIELDLVK